MQVDETDKKIINELLLDSRLSYRKLGKKVGVSAATIMKRVNALEKNRIIKGYTTVLNYDNLKYDIQAIVELRVAKGKLFQVEKKIAIHPNVYAVYDKTGSWDATVLTRFKTRRGLDNFLKKIQSFDFVERTQTHLILNIVKEDGTRLQ